MVCLAITGQCWRLLLSATREQSGLYLHKGPSLASMIATEEGSGLFLSKGLAQAGIGVTNEISIVEMYNSKGILGAFFAASDGGGSCSINNHQGFAGTVLRTSKAGGGIVDVLDGWVQGTLSASAGGSLELKGVGRTSLKAGSICIDSPLAYPNQTFRWP